MLAKEIISYMGVFQLGECRRSFNRELEIIFPIHGQGLREIVSQQRAEGVPIRSSDYGYFYAANEEELKCTIRKLTSQITQITKSSSGLVNDCTLYLDNRQLRLPLK